MCQAWVLSSLRTVWTHYLESMTESQTILIQSIDKLHQNESRE